MDKSNELKNYDYSYLRRLPLEKLLELLAIVPTLSDAPEDEAHVDALEEAIIEKENQNPTGFFPDVDQQWEQFVAHYMPEIDKSALECEPEKHAVLPQTHQHVPPKRVIRLKQAGRMSLAAAAAIILAFAIMLTAQAAGIDVFGAMARWTDEIFSFGQIAPGSEASDSLEIETGEQGAESVATEQEYSSLQEALDAYGVTEVHEPGWLPEGYTMERIDVLHLEGPFLQTFVVSYSDGEGRVSINIRSYEDEPAVQVQKTGAPVEVVEWGGIMFYLIENINSDIVAWYDDENEYYVSGTIGKKLLQEVAISMYK